MPYINPLPVGLLPGLLAAQFPACLLLVRLLGRRFPPTPYPRVEPNTNTQYQNCSVKKIYNICRFVIHNR